MGSEKNAAARSEVFGDDGGAPPPSHSTIINLVTGEGIAPTRSMVINFAAHRDRLVSMMEQSPELQMSLDLYTISDMALSQLKTQVGVSRLALWMDTGQRERPPILLRSHGIRKQWARVIGTACGLPILEHLRRTESIQPVSSLRELVDPAPLRIVQEAGIHLFAPVVAKGKVFGFIGLGTPEERDSFGEMDLRVLNASLGMLGVALENTGMYNRLVEKHRQLEATNETLRELDRLKNQFVSNVNHELRTPLTIILAYLDILRESGKLDPEQTEHLETIETESRKLKGLIEKLLEFSNVADEGPEVKLHAGDVVSVVRSCFEERLPGVSGSLRELSMSTDEPVPHARFDPSGVRLILELLVDNAVKFTPQGSQIAIRVRRWESGMRPWVRIDVEDDGPGIPPDRIRTIFEPFRQGDGSSTRQVGGMGLGLAYAHKLAARMGGELMVDEGARQGALFSLLLGTQGD